MSPHLSFEASFPSLDGWENVPLCAIEDHGSCSFSHSPAACPRCSEPPQDQPVWACEEFFKKPPLEALGEIVLSLL